MKPRYISLLSDSTFKYLFKKKNYRFFFEEVIKYTTGIDIRGYKLLDNELNSGNRIKDYRLDILLEKENHLISIEMNQYVYPYIHIKNETYLYRLAGSGYLESDQYKRKYVTQINFNNSRSSYAGVIDYELQNREYNLVIEGIKKYEIHLLNYKGIRYNGSNKNEMYLSMFTAKSYEELEKIIGESKEGKKMYEELKRLGIDDKYNAYYDAEIVHKKEMNSARYEERKEGMRVGSKNREVEIAKNLLNMKLPIEDVIKVTGLSKKEVNKLMVS